MMVSFSGTITVTKRTNASTQTLFTQKYQELPKPPESNNPDVKSYTGVLHYRSDNFVTFIYESQTIASEKVYIGGIPWSFIVKAKKVNGNNGAPASNVLGFFARCGYDFDKDNDNSLNKITANVEMSMKPSNDSSKDYTRKFNETYSKGHSEWGYAEFRTIEEGLVQSHKSCVFEAKITVVRPKPETSQENLVKKTRGYMEVATMQAKRGNIDLALEANDQAFTFCFEKKDDAVLKELEAQRDELIDMKVKDSIERLQKEKEDEKSTIPLRSACNLVGVTKKPPKNNNGNQRTRIKLTAPVKTKIMTSVGVNTEEDDDGESSSTLEESSPVAPKPLEVLTPATRDELDVSKELNGLVAIFKLLFCEQTKQRKHEADLVKIEFGLIKLMNMKSCAFKSLKFTADSSNLHRTLEKLIDDEVNTNNNESFRTPNGLANLLASMIFSSTDMQCYNVDMKKHYIQAAKNNRNTFKSVSLICQTFFALAFGSILRKFGVTSYVEIVTPEATNEFLDCVDETTLPPHFKQILNRLANNTLCLEVFLNVLVIGKDDYLKDFLAAHQTMVQNFKNMESTYNQKFETQTIVKRLTIEHLELSQKLNQELRDRLARFLMLEKNCPKSLRRPTFKGTSHQKLFKDNEKMKHQVRRCEQLLGRLNNERDDLLKSKAEAAIQVEKQHETMVKEIDECKKSVTELDMKLNEANNALNSKPSFSIEKESLRMVYLKTLEQWYRVAAEKIRIINFYLEKDKRYLTALLPWDVEICIVQRRSNNSTILKSIQSCLNSITEEMNMVKNGTLPMNFSTITIPKIFVAEFGVI